MAANNKTEHASVQAAALPAQAQEPVFKPFEWAQRRYGTSFCEGTAVETFSLTRDLASGAALVLQIIERDLIDEDFEDVRPLLPKHQQQTLMRYAIASMLALTGAAEQQLDWISRRQYEARAEANGGGS